MSRIIVATLMAFALAGCHTTDFGRSVGWPAPEQPSRSFESR